MEKRTLEQLEATLETVARDLGSRVEELARKSSAGTLSEDEHAEYSEIVRMNDLLSALRLQARDYWTQRTKR
jgi:hypothetical protein